MRADLRIEFGVVYSFLFQDFKKINFILFFNRVNCNNYLCTIGNVSLLTHYEFTNFPDRRYKYNKKMHKNYYTYTPLLGGPFTPKKQKKEE